MYIPTEYEIENCEKGKCCEYGICDECLLNEKEKEDE